MHRVAQFLPFRLAADVDLVCRFEETGIRGRGVNEVSAVFRPVVQPVAIAGRVGKYFQAALFGLFP